jgi:hypothetical protein
MLRRLNPQIAVIISLHIYLSIYVDKYNVEQKQNEHIVRRNA